MNKEPDFNIDEYEIGELLDIFNITQPVQKEAIMKIAGEFIGKYRQLEQSEYVEFFSKAMNKLVSNYQQVEGILGKVDTILDDAIESKQNIKQTVEDLQERAEDMYEDAQDIYEDVKETVQGMYEDTQEKASNLMEKAEETFEQVQEKAEDIYEQGVDAYQDAKKITNEFLNPKVEDAGPNVLKNRYYNGQTAPERVGFHVMPNRGDYISVPNDQGVEQHATQLQQRLMLPNAFAQIPYAQGYRNPTLQNAYISWVNVDSQYREIKPRGIATANCSKYIDPSNNNNQIPIIPNAVPATPTPTPPPGALPRNNIIYQTDTSTDFCFKLQTPITNVLAMTLASIEIPLSGYYAFSNSYGNTDFEIIIEGNTIPVSIPEGNYDASGIMTYINSYLKQVLTSMIPPSITWPQLFINKSNQKAYFAYYPTTPTLPKPVSIRWFNSTKHPSRKINSTLGWSLGFRQETSQFKMIYTSPPNTPYFPVADSSLNAITPHGGYYGTFGSCVWNELGTKYFILEVDDFNKNRNSGNMGTMTMPSCTEKFKLPSYAKQLSQVYPICKDPSNATVDPSNVFQPYPQNYPINTSFNLDKTNKHLTFKGIDANLAHTKGYYENFKRSCRKGTPAEKFGVKGQDTLTKAQKYTARELSNARTNSCTNQYYAPQASNILFRFPIERLSSNLQSPLIVPNSAGMANGRRYFGPVTIEKLCVRLLDDKGNPVDLHCADISFSLIMERLYQY